MKTINIVAGDTVKCTNCGREIAMTAELLLTLRDEHFPSRVNPDLYVADLERFKCKTCGRQELEFPVAA